MAILAEANEAWDLSQAKAPTGMALAVDEGLSFLSALTDRMGSGEAFAVASDSNSSIEVKPRRSTTRSTRPRRRPIPSSSQLPSRSPSPTPRRRPPRLSSRLGGRRGRGRDNHEKEEKSTCRHWKLFGRHQAHPNVSKSKCNWNKKIKFWRPEWVVKKMGLPYIQHNYFDKAHGARRMASRV